MENAQNLRGILRQPQDSTWLFLYLITQCNSAYVITMVSVIIINQNGICAWFLNQANNTIHLWNLVAYTFDLIEIYIRTHRQGKRIMSNNTFLPPLHPNFQYRVDFVGYEKTPVLVIDNFLHEAEALLGFAVKFGEFRDGTDYYPGIQSKVPDFYSLALQTYLRDIICKTFSIAPEQISHSRSMYSMVLTPPQKLAPPQSRPHTDTINKNKIACVHYLCTPDKGGTSLYRHRASGFETLTPERMDTYAEHFERELQDLSWQKKYICGSNQYYEEIARYEAKFNRLIMYPGDALHSASIPENFQFKPNPIIGRLTLNSFIYLK